jgi:hypothetical protein
MLRVLRWGAVISWMLIAAACSSSSDDDGAGPGSSNPSESGPCAELVDKLKSCDLATESSGTASCKDELIPECVVDCIVAASCEDVGLFFCTDQEPAAIASCRSSCVNEPLDCGDGSGTYSASWACDGIPDCANGADEEDCAFLCEDGTAISNAWQCDGIADCSNGEDEVDCISLVCTEYLDPEVPEDAHAGCEPFGSALAACDLVSEGPIFCSPGMTPCLAECYAAESCEELTAAGCTGMPTQRLIDCALACPRTYSCDGLSGLPPEFVCDGVPHCADGSDEPPDCPTHTCDNGEVIPLQYLCDGQFFDCSDQSDETGCATLVCPEP